MATVSELCEFCRPSFRYVAEWYVQTEADLEDSGKLPRALCGSCLQYFKRRARDRGERIEAWESVRAPFNYPHRSKVKK